jgi:beta-N-acetylhexosaminidase
MSDLEQAAAGIIVAAIEGFSLNQDERRVFSRRSPAGVTLFRRNIPENYLEASELNHQIQSLAQSSNLPLIIAVDQEGGRVARLRGDFPNSGAALSLEQGEAGPGALSRIEDYGEKVGKALKDIGFNVNFAPVVDVLSEPKNKVIGDRVFGKEPQTVVSRAGAFLKGMQTAGILGCLKHFPGQGGGCVDTHLGRDIISTDMELLEARDIRPFKELMPLCPMVMISHSIFEAMDSKFPASLSRRVISDYLRGVMGYTGVIVSDDMNMGALPQERQQWLDALVTAVRSGADLLLICQHLDRFESAVERLILESEKDSEFKKRVSQAHQRVLQLRSRLVC